LKYSSARTTLRKAKATLLRTELEKSSKRLSKIHESIAESEQAAGEAKSKIAEIDFELSKKDKERAKISEEISVRGQRDKLFREMEGVKSELSSKRQALQDTLENLQRVRTSLASLAKEAEEEKKAIESLSKDTAGLKKQLAPFEGLSFEHKESESVAALRTSLKSAEDERALVREQMLILGGEIEKSDLLVAEKEKSLQEEAGAGSAMNTFESLEKELANLRANVQEIVVSMDNLFSREKELNMDNAELDKETLKMRENIATLRAQTSPAAMNPSLQYIAELRASGEIQGIHGTVAELIEFKADYSKAVDAAGSGRLLHVVVDSADVAIKVISLLKKAGRGRATFIPLKEVVSPKIDAKGGKGALADLVKCDSRYRKAIDFVFGNTILIDDAKEAKKMGIGTERMVTLDGDLFEKSGIITGGTMRSGIASAAQLSKMEAELDSARKRKTAIIDELTHLREEMSTLRKEKVEAEVALKRKEVDSESLREKHTELEKKEKRKKEVLSEISALKKSAESSRSKLESYTQKSESSDAAVVRIAQELENALKAESSRMQLLEKEQKEKVELLSSLRSRHEAAARETELRKESLKQKTETISESKKEERSLTTKETSTKSKIAELEGELQGIETRIGEADNAVRKLMDKIKEFEALLQGLGQKRGKFNEDFIRQDKNLATYKVEASSLETRVVDLTAELEEFKEVPSIEGKKEELMELMKSSESLLSELGAVNLSAPELYEQKAKEVAEMKEKIEKLRIEKEAIINMINSIDDKKKEAYFETFHAVDKNFRELFKYVNIGEGHLFMDKPSTPFESGLFIKVRKNGHDHALESLSGGEKSLVALMFVFALQFFKPSPFYILDEVDSALDKINSKNLANLLIQLAPQSQFLVVSHNDIMMSMASAVLGVSKVDGVSRIVGVKLERKSLAAVAANPAPTPQAPQPEK
jgi:chromosome segregation protein